MKMNRMVPGLLALGFLTAAGCGGDDDATLYEDDAAVGTGAAETGFEAPPATDTSMFGTDTMMGADTAGMGMGRDTVRP